MKKPGAYLAEKPFEPGESLVGPSLETIYMKSLDLLRKQLDEILTPYRDLPPLAKPRNGWIKTLQEALGMTNVQFARRAKRKAAQSIEDVQNAEIDGTIRLRTMEEIARHLDARFVYAIVPNKPLNQIREDQAKRRARALQKMVSHSMRLEAQGVDAEVEEREFNRMVNELLAGNPKKLWQ